jgi:hypothetical protein
MSGPLEEAMLAEKLRPIALRLVQDFFNRFQAEVAENNLTQAEAFQDLGTVVATNITRELLFRHLLSIGDPRCQLVELSNHDAVNVTAAFSASLLEALVLKMTETADYSYRDNGSTHFQMIEGSSSTLH